MTDLIKATQEMVEIVAGLRPAPRIFLNGHYYVPEPEPDAEYNRGYEDGARSPWRTPLQKDGFFCAPDFALDEALLLNLGQAAASQDRFQTGEILADYCSGSLTSEEAKLELRELAGV